MQLLAICTYYPPLSLYEIKLSKRKVFLDNRSDLAYTKFCQRQNETKPPKVSGLVDKIGLLALPSYHISLSCQAELSFRSAIFSVVHSQKKLAVLLTANLMGI